MNANQLLDGIGDAKGNYIWEAQRHRCGEIPPKKRIPLRKTLLIAAVIALMLLLVGCAVVCVFHLQDLKIGEYSRRSTGEVGNALSVQGFAGSPGYQAAKEWYEWKQAYDPDLTVYHSEEAFSEDYGEDYWEYNLYSREMKDKVDDICAKYGLELLGRAYFVPNTEDAFRALGISGITKPGARAEIQLLSNYFYQNGSFQIEGYVTPTGEDCPWPYSSLFQFVCTRKDCFMDTYIAIGDLDRYEQWTYTTGDGTEVLLALSSDGALMLADKGEYFLAVLGINTRAGNVLDGEYTMDRAGLEAHAELFDFTIRPQRVSGESLAAVEELQAEEAARLEQVNKEREQKRAEFEHFLGKESYAARVTYHLENDFDAERLGFTFLDLDGNGTQELIIGKDGYIQYIYTETDGETAEIYGWANSAPVYLTEDGYLIQTFDVGDVSLSRYFNKVIDGKLVTEKVVLHDISGFYGTESPWRLVYAFTQEDDHPITEAEFWEIYNSPRGRVVLDMLPLTEYPLEEKAASGSSQKLRVDNDHESYSSLVRDSIINPPESAPGEYITCRYALLDLNGDGQEELYWDEDYVQRIYTMKDGKLVTLLWGAEVDLCQDHIVQVVHSYPGSSKTYCYYRIDGFEPVLVDYLRYDQDRDPANPWFRSTDASGQDISLVPITQTEFDSIRASYPPVELNRKPITEYPLG